MEQDFFEGHEDGTLKAEYADCFRICHSAHKFVMDFGQSSSDGAKNYFHTRVITGPDTAKALVEKLEESIREYQAQYDQIKKGD